MSFNIVILKQTSILNEKQLIFISTEWVEISPFEVSIPKYGVWVNTRNFGSQFTSGMLVEELEELPLYYILGKIMKCS